MKKQKLKEKPELFLPCKPENPDTGHVYNGKSEVAFYYRYTAAIYGYSSEFGRANGLLDCPWCGKANRVYVWSLSGGGKRCEGCGAMLGARMGRVSPEAFKRYKEIQTEKLAQEAAERFPETLKQLQQ